MISSMILILILAIFKQVVGGKDETSFAVFDRFTSLFTGSKLVESSTLQDRFTENGFALDNISEHPVLGIGLGTEYRPSLYGKKDEILYFVHNNYLWIVLDTGVTGLVFYMWFFLGFIIRALNNWRTIKDDYLRSALLGFMLSGTAMLFQALVDPVFMYWFSIVIIAIIAGLSEVIININSNELQSG